MGASSHLHLDHACHTLGIELTGPGEDAQERCREQTLQPDTRGSFGSGVPAQTRGCIWSARRILMTRGMSIDFTDM
jgi:hypothetical protein